MRQNKTTTITDWHCHILPGIDDGAKTLDDAIAIASILVDNGFSEVYCTPHCMKGVFENTPEIVRQAVIALQAELDKVEIPLKLHVGMEYFLDEFFPQQLNNPLTLGNTNYLLVEAPIRADPKRIKDFLFTIRRRGCTPLLAHPERYEFLAPAAPPQSFFRRFKRRRKEEHQIERLDLVQELLGMGCFFQGNLGSFSGIYGTDVKIQAESFYRAGAYTCFGSDAHNPTRLPRILEQGLLATADCHASTLKG
ncbi:MAG: phosphoesterase [Deltaproteobacteria bacterium]|nr:phosphoesterase [Deltaproteobacteria bacterium]NCP02776.1 phosphoesterase [Deltaproteobacteria bacterium]